MNIMINLPLFISFTESAFIVFILVMIFGADKIPEIARGLGKGIRGIKTATDEIKGEVMKNVYDSDKKEGGVTGELESYTSQIKKDLEEVTKSVK